jgi:DNA-3-methyladenine glycosylase I
MDIYLRYHDEEWGVPVHDDRTQFEFLVLEGAQAGLSWLTILRKRENYRAAFDNFDPEKVARYGRQEVERLLSDSGIVRNRLKIHAAIENARRFLDVQSRYGSFDAYLWEFVDGKTVKNCWKSTAEIPTSSELSERISKDLKSRGFKFVGPTIIYSHLQAVGIVNDHITACFRYEELGGRSTSR